MKKTGLIVLYIILAAAIIGAALWYNNKSDEAMQQAAVAQGVATTQAQSQLMSELTINDLVVGTGTVAAAGDTLSVLYTGTLDNGTVFDASSLHGNQPFSFVLGVGNVNQ
jgi:FKBP-type peptidyl-prolyl cis-trans isomerase